MRLCDEKDSLHGRVFFCEKNAVRIDDGVNEKAVYKLYSKLPLRLHHFRFDLIEQSKRPGNQSLWIFNLLLLTLIIPGR